MFPEFVDVDLVTKDPEHLLIQLQAGTQELLAGAVKHDTCIEELLPFNMRHNPDNRVLKSVFPLHVVLLLRTGRTLKSAIAESRRMPDGVRLRNRMSNLP